VDVAVGQIPRSTERISSFGTKIVTFTYLFCLFCSSCLFSHHIVLSPLHALPTIVMCIVKNAVTPVWEMWTRPRSVCYMASRYFSY